MHNRATQPLKSALLLFRVIFFIAGANLLAIGLDIASVLLGEYAFNNVVIDISVETVSFLTIVAFYSLFKTAQ